MADRFIAPAVNFLTTTLNGAINSTQTTGITLTSATNFATIGVIVVDRQDGSGNNTPSAREVISYTGISGSALTGVTRGAEGSTARAHNDGALVETMPTIGLFNSLASIVDMGLDTQGLPRATASPVSLSVMRLIQTDVTSVASIARAEVPFIRAPSALVSVASILGHLNVSGASISGLERTFVWYMPGFASAATTNVMRLITPFGGTFRAFTMTTRTPVSTASLTIEAYNIRSGASIFNTVGRPNILGGGTYVSTASILTPTFTSGDTIRADISTGGNVADITLEGIAY